MGLDHGGGDLSSLAPRLWVAAWAAQVQADIDAAERLVTEGVCSSTVCMLLQMVFEKLTKMAYCLGGSTFPREHGCVEYLIRVLKRSPQRKSVYLPNRDVLELVLDLEALNPSVAKAKRALDPSRVVPQLEYPWEDMDAGRVMSPATDLRILTRLQHLQDQTLQRTILFAKFLANNLPDLV